MSVTGPTSSTTTLCKYPCCKRKVYQDAHRTYDYCGRTHAQEHKRIQQHKSVPMMDGVKNGSYLEEVEDAKFERELRLTIAESLKLEKRKRDMAADEELARKLQLEEEQQYCRYPNTTNTATGSCTTSWTCSLCTFHNSSSSANSTCDVCGAPFSSSSSHTANYASVLPQQAPSTKSSSRPTTNSKSNTIDEEYYHLRQLQELEEYWNAKEESLRVASKIWTCVTCHKTNEKDVVECPQCLEPKAASTKLHQLQLKLWPCSKCTFDNSFADAVCFMCGKDVPTSLRHLLNHARPSECGMPGCCKKAIHYGFCSKLHFDLALEKNIIPPCESGIEAVLVGHTGDYSAHLLRSSHPKHASVKKQFLDSWKKTTEGYPRVQRIYWIRMAPEILENFDLMKLQLGNCNVQRLFHGTGQLSTCYFGTNPYKPPCNSKNCRVCSIIRTSFDLTHVKRGEGGKAWAHQTQQLRYGVRFLFRVFRLVLLFIPNTSLHIFILLSFLPFL